MEEKGLRECREGEKGIVPSRLGIWGSVASSPSRVQGRVLAKNSFDAY